MKKKLHVSFWALGILVLLLSQLIALVPASHAFAAAPSLDDYNTSARKYSAYAAFHECLLKVPAGYKTSGTELGQGKLFGGLTGSLVVIGYINDIGSGDGTVFCDEAAQKWYEQAGYSDVPTMMTDLGFVSNTSTSPCGGMATQTCTNTSWDLNVAPSVLSSKHQALAKSRNIPLSMVGTTGIKYSLAVAALQSSSCGATLTAAAGGGPDTVALLDDSSGAITYKSINWGSTPTTSGSRANGGGTSVTAYPDPVNSNTSGSTTTCSGIVDYLNSAQGTSYFAAAMVATRVNATSADIATAACAKAGITDKTKLATCIKDFTGWAKACIQDYYTNNATIPAGSTVTTPSTAYSTTFDVNVVANCVYKKMNASPHKDWYKKVTLADLTTMIQQGMDTNTPASSSTDPSKDPCSLLPSETQMRWLACSLLLAGSGIADAFFNAIQSLLYTPTTALFGADNFKTMASTFRIIGMALLIIIGLVMIIAQASGSDIVDAYTVKKVLPKIGIALVGMALAWPLLRLVVGATNDIGIGLGSFVKDLAGSSTNSAATNSGDVVSLITAGFIGGGAGTAIMVVSLGAWGILSLLGTVILALLIGLAVLAFRQLLIVMLILLAPLAIAASVMPGTDKLWKFWRTTLLSTLMMFPIIMLFLSSGHLMASIFGSMDGDKTINSLMAVLVYFAPYFLLPFAFKMAGGLMANIFQIANDKGKGAFDRLRNGRGEIRKDRLKRAGSGHLWDASNPIQKAFKGNAVASWIGDPKGTGAYTMRNVPGFRRAGGAIKSKIEAAQTEHTSKIADELLKGGANDRVGNILNGNLHHKLTKETQQRLSDAGLLGKNLKTSKEFQTAASILAMSDSNDPKLQSGVMAERNAAGTLNRFAGRLATLNQDSEVGKANIAAAGLLITAATGYAGGQEIVDAASGFDKTKYADGLKIAEDHAGKLTAEMGEGSSSSIVSQAINVAGKGRPEVAAGYTVIRNENGDYTYNKDYGDGDNRMNVRVLRMTASDFSGAKPESWDEIAEAVNYNLENAEGGKYTAQVDQLANLIGPWGSSNPEYKAKVLDFVDTLPPKLRDEIKLQSGRRDPTLPSGGGPGGGDPGSPTVGGRGMDHQEPLF